MPKLASLKPPTDFLRNFCPVRESYALRKRSSGDKDRQRGGERGRSHDVAAFRSGRIEGKDFQEQSWRSRAVWAPAAGGPYAVPMIERGKEPAEMPTLHVLKCQADKEGEGKLLHFPGVAGAKQLGEVARTAFGDDGLDLFIHDVFVAGNITPGAEDADGRGEIWAAFHVGELEGVGGKRVMRVVDDGIGFGDAVAKLDYFDVAIRFPTDALVAVLAEDHRLPVFELEHVFAAGIALGEVEPRAIVEDVAVLEDFDVGGTFVRGGVPQRVLQVALEDVDGTGDEGGFSADGQRNGIEWTVHRAEGR